MRNGCLFIIVVGALCLIFVVGYVVYPEYRFTRSKLEYCLDIKLPRYSVKKRSSEGYLKGGEGSINIVLKFKKDNIRILQKTIEDYINSQTVRKEELYYPGEWSMKDDSTYRFYYRLDCVYIDADFNINTGILSFDFATICGSSLRLI